MAAYSYVGWLAYRFARYRAPEDAEVALRPISLVYHYRTFVHRWRSSKMKSGGQRRWLGLETEIGTVEGQDHEFTKPYT